MPDHSDRKYDSSQARAAPPALGLSSAGVEASEARAGAVALAQSRGRRGRRRAPVACTVPSGGHRTGKYLPELAFAKE